MKTVLDEIIEKKASGNNVFNEYKTKAKIGEQIFEELYSRFDFEKKGFIMNDISKEVGLLSQCQSLQALVSLALDFNLGFDTKSIIKGQQYSIREIMDFTIEDIIDRIVVKDEEGNVKEFVFDASPYDSSNTSSKESKYFTAEYSNIDSLTWVIPSFFTVLKYHANLEQPEICQWEDILVQVIKHGIKYLNEAYIDSEESDGSISVGWNFTKDCQEPSLFFSFAVGECYLDIFSAFEDILKYPYAKQNKEKYGVYVDQNVFNEYEEKLKKYTEDMDKQVLDPKYAKHDSYNEMVRLYKRINDIGELEEIYIENTIYGELERRCRELAFRVWDHVKDGLADNFFYNDLKTTLSEDEILKSTTSDALFNTVYIVNIMLAGGLDEQMEFLKTKALVLSEDNKAEGKTAEEWQLESDNLFESCQLAIQKAFRTYEFLKTRSKDYIVDQFLIGFNERFDNHKSLVNELRKLRMKTFSLLPMLIHTHNVVSEYLIKYPQHNMQRYLEYILENRYFSVDEQRAHWIWEKDGYFSGSNCYYIVALNEFYIYHQKYERDYIKIGEKNAEVKQKVRDRAIDDYRKQLKAPGGDIAKLEEEKAEQEKIIKKQEQEILRLKEMGRPVEEAVLEVMNEELDKRFATLLQDTFSYAAKALTVDCVDDTSDESKVYAGICSSLYEMIFAEIFANYYTIDAKRNKYRFNDVDDYHRKAEDFRTDLKATIAAYITSINSYACMGGETEKKSILRNILDDNKQ